MMPPSKYPKGIRASVSPEMYRLLHEISRRDHVSMSELVRIALDSRYGVKSS